MSRIRRFWRRQEPDGLPPTPRGQRVLLAGAAVVMALAIGFALLMPHVEFLRWQRAADPVRPCAAGQSKDCVGGTMGVVVVAPPASQAAPNR
jgi:hypothetical protein